MESLFLTIFNMSVTACYVIVAVLLVRLLLRKAPKKYSYLLWSVVGFRLACPFSFQSAFSLFSLKLFDLSGAQESGGSTLQYMPQDVGMMKAPEMTSGLANQIGGAIPLPAPQSPVQSANPMQIILAFCALLWCAGIAVMLLYSFVCYARIRYRMRTAVLLEGNVYQSDQVRSPFILGFIRPKIYIPFGLEERMQKYVLLHERYHLKRRDHIVKLFSFLLLTIHWFNPLCWIAFFLMGKDMEMSCDEKVLSKARNIRRLYSTALLSFAANRRFPAPGPLSFGETGVKQRIRNVLGWKTPKPGVTVFATILCIALLTACAANPAKDEPPQEQETAQTEEQENEQGGAQADGREEMPEESRTEEQGDAQADRRAEMPEESQPESAAEDDIGAADFKPGSVFSWDVSDPARQNSVEIDLDGDGSAERVTLTSDNPVSSDWGERYYYHGYVLQVDGHALEEWGDYTEREIIAFAPDAGQLLLGIFDEGPSDDPITRFYRYDAGGLHTAGSVPGDIRTLQVDQNGFIKCPYRFDILQTSFVWSYWYWNGTEIVMRQDEEYEFVHHEDSEAEITLLEPLPVYPAREESGNALTMQPQKVEEVRTDLEEWVLLRAADGTEGWLRAEMSTIPSLGGKSTREVFEGLNFYD